LLIRFYSALFGGRTDRIRGFPEIEERNCDFQAAVLAKLRAEKTSIMLVRFLYERGQRSRKADRETST